MLLLECILLYVPMVYYNRAFQQIYIECKYFHVKPIYVSLYVMLVKVNSQMIPIKVLFHMTPIKLPFSKHANKSTFPLKPLKSTYSTDTTITSASSAISVVNGLYSPKTGSQ